MSTALQRRAAAVTLMLAGANLWFVGPYTKYREINRKYIDSTKVKLFYFIQAFRNEINSIKFKTSFLLSGGTRTKDFYQTIRSYRKLTVFVRKKIARKNTIRAWQNRDYRRFFRLVFRLPIKGFSFLLKAISFLSKLARGLQFILDLSGRRRIQGGR